jgi:hypothetical protein
MGWRPTEEEILGGQTASKMGSSMGLRLRHHPCARARVPSANSEVVTARLLVKEGYCSRWTARLRDPVRWVGFTSVQLCYFWATD